MRPDVVILSVVALFVLGCKAASFIKEQQDALFHAITEGKLEDFETALNEYQGDVTEKVFNVKDGDTDIMLSPLELTIKCHYAQKMTNMIMNKRLHNINIDIFDFVFKSGCVGCFNDLLRSSLLNWSCNKAIIESILKHSKDKDHFIIFISRFMSRLDLNEQLSLIETTFNSGADHEKISAVVDTAISDVLIKTASSEYLVNDRCAAVISFARAMILKKDFDDMLTWIDLLYHEYPETWNSKFLIEVYKDRVRIYDKRIEDYPQPEDLIMRDGFKVFLNLWESMAQKSKICCDRVLLKTLNKNNKKIWSILENSPLFNKNMEETNYLLDLTIENNCIQCAELLLEAGFKFSHESFFKAIAGESTEMVGLLIKHGADLNCFGVYGDAPITVAVHKSSDEIFELLLKHGANPNIANYYGNTPLLEAAEKGYTEKIKLLLKYGSIIDASNSDNVTPLMSAVDSGFIESVNALLESGADANIADINGNTPLLKAASNGSVEIVNLLLKKGADRECTNNNGFTPLMEAVLKGSAETVKLLLRDGANISATDKKDRTALSLAVWEGLTEMVQLLLSEGAAVNVLDRSGSTPLMGAAFKGYADIAKLLLDKGADTKVINHGLTALDIAVKFGHGNVEALLRDIA